MRVDPFLDDLNKRFPRRSPEPPVSKILLRGVVLFVRLWLLLAILICFASTECHAQTISPVISECKGPRCRGEIVLTNNQIVPLAAYIETQSLAASDGKVLYRHLDSGINIRLTNNSARLGPRQSYVIGYEITCREMPCVVNLGTVFQGLHTKEGLAVALHLGSVIYLCSDKAKGCRERTRQGWGIK